MKDIGLLDYQDIEALISVIKSKTKDQYYLQQKIYAKRIVKSIAKLRELETEKNED